MFDGPRISSEKKTVDAMILLYCNKIHGTNDELPNVKSFMNVQCYGYQNGLSKKTNQLVPNV